MDNIPTRDKIQHSTVPLYMYMYMYMYTVCIYMYISAGLYLGWCGRGGKCVCLGLKGGERTKLGGFGGMLPRENFTYIEPQSSLKMHS